MATDSDPDRNVDGAGAPDDPRREATDLIEAAITDAGGLAQLARISGVSKHTLGRYRKGEFPWERRNHQLDALDRHLTDRGLAGGEASGPSLLQLVERATPANRPRRGASQSKRADASGPGAGPVSSEVSADGADRRRIRWAAVLCVTVIALARLLAIVMTRDDGDARTAPVPAFTAQVDGTGPGEDPTEPITVWDRPATNICSSATPECDPDATGAGVVQPGQRVDTLCVTKGQVVRNGPPGEPGFYDDDRWVMIDSGGEEAFLSNTWYARSGLPRDLPSCPPRN